MKRMLVQNPDERISASEALKHPYFYHNGVNTDKSSPMIDDGATIGSATKIVWESPDY